MENHSRKNVEGYIDTTAYEAVKNVQRQLQGKRSKITGGYFESMISAACSFYDEKDFAHIEKTPEPMKVLKPMPKQPGRFIACFEKAAQPDYKGTIKGGQSIVFEAKHTDSDRIERGRLTLEQMSGLEQHHKLGALTFIIVSFGFQDFFRIEWTAWRDMKKSYGRKYLKANELEGYRISQDYGVLKLLSGIV